VGGGIVLGIGFGLHNPPDQCVRRPAAARLFTHKQLADEVWGDQERTPVEE
jgi:hypothetical protein